jgi:hypothetical protein
LLRLCAGLLDCRQYSLYSNSLHYLILPLCIFFLAPYVRHPTQELVYDSCFIFVLILVLI